MGSLAIEMLAIPKYGKITKKIASDLAGKPKDANSSQVHEVEVGVVPEETATPDAAAMPNNISNEDISTSPEAMSEEGTSTFMSNEEYLRIWFTLVGILAAAAIALSQGGNKQKKILRSFNLTAQIAFALSFLFAVTGIFYIYILRNIANARNRTPGSFSNHTLKIGILVASTGLMLMGIFIILSMNIGRASN